MVGLDVFFFVKSKLSVLLVVPYRIWRSTIQISAPFHKKVVFDLLLLLCEIILRMQMFS